MTLLEVYISISPFIGWAAWLIITCYICYTVSKGSSLGFVVWVVLALLPIPAVIWSIKEML
jgi:hypothetical protein